MLSGNLSANCRAAKKTQSSPNMIPKRTKLISCLIFRLKAFRSFGNAHVSCFGVYTLIIANASTFAVDQFVFPGQDWSVLKIMHESFLCSIIRSLVCRITAQQRYTHANCVGTFSCTSRWAYMPVRILYRSTECANHVNSHGTAKLYPRPAWSRIPANSGSNFVVKPRRTSSSVTREDVKSWWINPARHVWKIALQTGRERFVSPLWACKITRHTSWTPW